jgi:hypothetical protein
MKYLLIICADESVHVSSAEDAEIQRDTRAWLTEMDGRGVRLDGHRLRPVSDATSVRVRDHHPMSRVGLIEVRPFWE